MAGQGETAILQLAGEVPGNLVCHAGYIGGRNMALKRQALHRAQVPCKVERRGLGVESVCLDFLYGGEDVHQPFAKVGLHDVRRPERFCG